MNCVFIKNGVVVNVAFFAEKDEVLAAAMAAENAYDEYKFNEVAGIGWEWDGKKFVDIRPIDEPINEVVLEA